MNPKNTIGIALVVRAIAQVFAGYLAGKGALTGDQESQATDIICSILLFLATLAWSWIEKRRIVAASPPQQQGSSSSRVGPMPCVALLLLAGVMLFAQVGCQHVGNDYTQSGPGGSVVSKTNAANRATWTDEYGTLHADGGVGASTVTKITDGEIVQSKGGTSNRTVVMTKKPDGNVQLALSSDTDISAESLSFSNTTGDFEVRGFSTSVSEPQRAINEGLANVQAYWTSLSADQREARIADLKAIEAAGGQLGEFAGKLLQALVVP